MKMFSFFQVVAAALGLSSCAPVPMGHGGYSHNGYGHGGYGGRQMLVPTGQQVLVRRDGYGYSQGYSSHGGSRGIQPCDPRYYEPGRQYYYQPPPVTVFPSRHSYGGGGYGRPYGW